MDCVRTRIWSRSFVVSDSEAQGNPTTAALRSDGGRAGRALGRGRKWQVLHPPQAAPGAAKADVIINLADISNVVPVPPARSRRGSRYAYVRQVASGEGRGVADADHLAGRGGGGGCEEGASLRNPIEAECLAELHHISSSQVGSVPSASSTFQFVLRPRADLCLMDRRTWRDGRLRMLSAVVPAGCLGSE
eukprot:1816217-Rhodomonas_salina.1